MSDNYSIGYPCVMREHSSDGMCYVVYVAINVTYGTSVTNVGKSYYKVNVDLNIGLIYITSKKIRA